MKYTIDKSTKNKVKVVFNLDTAEWESAIETAYVKSKHKYSVQGFRKGHVPRKVLENMYGPSIFVEEAFNDAFSKCYYEMLAKETDIHPVAQPSVEVKEMDEKGVCFEAEIVVKPEVKLGAYTNLTIDKTVHETTEKDIEDELKAVADRNARFIDVTDRTVLDGDEVNLDYSGAIDGVMFDGGTAKAQTLVIGSNRFIPGFEEQMIGMAIGETKVLKIKFPDEYHADNLKGKFADFTVTVNAIKVKEVPAIDDELAKDVSEFETLIEYKADIKAKLDEKNRLQADNENKNKLFEKVVANAELTIPQEMIDAEVDNNVEEFEHMLSQQGLKLDDYLKYTNSSIEKFKEAYLDRAKKAVEFRLVAEAIVKTENIQTDEETVNKKVAEMAKQYGKEEKEFRASLDRNQFNYIHNEVLTEKLMEFLMASNTFEIKETKTKKK